MNNSKIKFENFVLNYDSWYNRFGSANSTKKNHYYSIDDNSISLSINLTQSLNTQKITLAELTYRPDNENWDGCVTIPMVAGLPTDDYKTILINFYKTLNK
jgi:hypothetical protein